MKTHFKKDRLSHGCENLFKKEEDKDRLSHGCENMRGKAFLPRDNKMPVMIMLVASDRRMNTYN